MVQKFTGVTPIKADARAPMRPCGRESMHACPGLRARDDARGCGCGRETMHGRTHLTLSGTALAEPFRKFLRLGVDIRLGLWESTSVAEVLASLHSQPAPCTDRTSDALAATRQLGGTYPPGGAEEGAGKRSERQGGGQAASVSFAPSQLTGKTFGTPIAGKPRKEFWYTYRTKEFWYTYSREAEPEPRAIGIQ